VDPQMGEKGLEGPVLLCKCHPDPVMGEGSLQQSEGLRGGWGQVLKWMGAEDGEGILVPQQRVSGNRVSLEQRDPILPGLKRPWSLSPAGSSLPGSVPRLTVTVRFWGESEAGRYSGSISSQAKWTSAVCPQDMCKWRSGGCTHTLDSRTQYPVSRSWSPSSLLSGSPPHQRPRYQSLGHSQGTLR
jgi:hypothetical protein